MAGGEEGLTMMGKRGPGAGSRKRHNDEDQGGSLKVHKGEIFDLTRANEAEVRENFFGLMWRKASS